MHLFVLFHPPILYSLPTSWLSTCSATGPALAAGNSGEPEHLSGRGADRAPLGWKDPQGFCGQALARSPGTHVRTRGPRSSPVRLPDTSSGALGPMWAPVLTTPQGRGHPSQPSLSPWEPLASCHHITPSDVELTPQIKHTLITHKRIVNVIY